MVAAMVKIDEEAEAGNRHQCREPGQGQYEYEWSRTQPTEQAFAQDGPARLLGGAVTLPAFIELGEYCPPLLAFRLFPLVEFIEMFLLGLDVAGKMNFGGAECLEPLPHPPPRSRFRYFLPAIEQRCSADHRRRKRDKDVENRCENRVRCKELAQWIPGESSGKPELITTQHPPDHEAYDAHAPNGYGRQPLWPGVLRSYI